VSIPTLALPTQAELSRPYLTAAQFTAYPTWLDLDNLVPGGAAGLQTDALNDVLLQASDWCNGVCEDMRLSAHWVQNENQRTRASGRGKIYLKPRDIPIRAVTALSYGWDPTAMAALPLPDASMWIEDGREVSFRPGGGLQEFTGPAIQFGGRVSSHAETYVTWSYVAGFPSTYMPSGVTSGAATVSVADPAGILPGDVLRIYDIGVSEALTVASTYVPALPTVPPTVTSVPIAGTVTSTHVATTGITGMPRKALQAVYAYGVALLMREDVSSEEPESGFGPAARTTGGQRGGQAAGLVNDALGWLAPYRPTLRS
jgi:hypothetical protein